MKKQVPAHRGGYLEALLTSCPYAILATDAEGTITFANDEACKLTERQMQELIGENIAVIYENIEAARETNRRLYMSGGVIHDHESKARTKSGKSVPIRISASHLKDSSGNYIGSVGYFERHRPWTTAEANLKIYTEELEAKLEEWKDLGTPVLELCPGLSAAAMVGHIDIERFEHIVTKLLSHIKSTESRIVIIDMSGALIEDANVLANLVKTIRTIQLLGAQCILAGVQSSAAKTMETLLPDVSSVKSFTSTSIAMEAALNLIGLSITRKS